MIRRNLTWFIMALGASALATVALLMGLAPQSTRDSVLLESRGAITGAGINGINASPDDSVAGGRAARASTVGGEYGEWALTDPDGFLAHVRSQAVIDGSLLTGLLNALIVAPEQVLDFAGSFSGIFVEEDRTLEEAAAMALAEQDATAALVYLRSLPATDRRYIRIRTRIAEGWARQDPDGAMVWAEGLEPAAPGVVAAVIAVTAENDVEAALQFYESFGVPSPEHPAVLAGVATAEAVARSIVRQIATNEARERMADQLLRDGTARSLIALEELTTYWAQVDAVAATQWVTRSANSLPPELPVNLVGDLAATDATAAVSLADRLPADMQLLVAGPIARGLAHRDGFAAVRWIDKFQEYPAEYRGLYRAALNVVAAADPASAAAMITGAPPAIELKYNDGNGGLSGVMRLEGEVAVAWARQDLSAASAWVQGISDSAGREDAAVELARYWLRADPSGAQRWVLNLPQGDARQSALQTLLADAASGGYEMEPRVVRAYGLETEQQEFLGGMIMNMAVRGDTRRALVLAREWISDSEVQQQTIQQIESLVDKYSLRDIDSN